MISDGQLAGGSEGEAAAWMAGQAAAAAAAAVAAAAEAGTAVTAVTAGTAAAAAAAAAGTAAAGGEGEEEEGSGMELLDIDDNMDGTYSVTGRPQREGPHQACHLLTMAIYYMEPHQA